MDWELLDEAERGLHRATEALFSLRMKEHARDARRLWEDVKDLKADREAAELIEQERKLSEAWRTYYRDCP